MLNVKIPWQVFACAGALVVLGAAGWYVYNLGQDHKQQEWNAAVERGKGIVENLKKQQEKITIKVETRTVERVKVVKEKGDAIIQRVPVYLPDSTLMLPGGFRVLHDAGATGTIPGAPESTNAAPVRVTDVARTTVQNYTTCLKVREELIGLQAWVQEQRRAYLEACKQQGVAYS